MATYLNPTKGFNQWLEKRGHNEESRIELLKQFKKDCSIKSIPNGRYRDDSRVAIKHKEIFKQFVNWYKTITL